MRRLLPILLFSMTVVSLANRADSIITYTATEQFTKQTPIEEDILWRFTGPQNFSIFDTLLPASPDRLDPSEKPGEWFFLASTGITSGSSPVSLAGLTFGTWGTFGHIAPRCWPNCPTGIGKFSLTFDTSDPRGYTQFEDRTFLGTFPVATPEPSDLLLFGTGVIGLGFVRKFRK